MPFVGDHEKVQCLLSGMTKRYSIFRGEYREKVYINGKVSRNVSVLEKGALNINRRKKMDLAMKRYMDM